MSALSSRNDYLKIVMNGSNGSKADSHNPATISHYLYYHQRSRSLTV